MMTYGAMLEIVLLTAAVFAGAFALGFLIRAQMMGGHTGKILIYLAVVALAGGLLGAHWFTTTPGGIQARHNQSATHQ